MDFTYESVEMFHIFVMIYCRLELVIEQLDDLREDVLKQEDQDGRTMSTSSPSLPPPSPSHHTDRGLDSKLNEILMLLRRQDV